MSNATLSADGVSGNEVTTSDTLTANALVKGNGTKDIVVTDTFLLEGTGQTISNVTDDLITFALGGSAKAYRIEGKVIGFESTTPAGPGWSFFGCVRTDGASATVIGTPTIMGEQDTLTDTQMEIVASSGDIIIRVTGETSLTVDWACSMEYIGVG